VVAPFFDLDKVVSINDVFVIATGNGRDSHIMHVIDLLYSLESEIDRKVLNRYQ
jgi:hypothetical protein